MTTRRLMIALLAAAPMLAAGAAGAAETTYTPEAFATAQKAGRPILVHITAPWCTTCAAQKPILAKLEAEPKFGDLQVFDVDFDSRKDVVHRFGATMQSTLIVYHGAAETGRSAGVTDPKAIASLLDKAL